MAAFIATQAEDGYLGPFPKAERLLKNWDLWGHYHALEALVLWHEHTGDPAALAAARQAADLVCRTYLDGGRRVLAAGDPEMNMDDPDGAGHAPSRDGRAALSANGARGGKGLGAGRAITCAPAWTAASIFNRRARAGRASTTCRDWSSCGASPGRRKYREAFIHHWRSIRRWDRHNTGAFSSGEQATGNPYAPAAIETCCTVAWMALTADYLRLTGDPLAADELELATLNGGLGAQHPSGRWWTYNTPMDGCREASAHDIVFQARAGTPELNCCSVNGPRVLGMLSEWAVMSAPGGLALNSYLPGTVALKCEGQPVGIEMDRDYPRVNSQRVRIVASGEPEWTLCLRIPAWSRNTGIRANFELPTTEPAAGSYLALRRRWKAGDEIGLSFDFALRAVPGANEAAGRVSLYRGPVLLAYDQASNPFDEDHLPAVNLARLSEARLVSPSPGTVLSTPPAWLRLDLPVGGDGSLRLVDFASAGANGTRYRSWLPAENPPPPPAFTQYPRDGGRSARDHAVSNGASPGAKATWSAAWNSPPTPPSQRSF